MPVIASLLCGFIFGTGLVVSGMVQTTKVLGFLDVLAIPSGGWDPSLIVVMMAGLAVTGIGFALIRPRPPVFDAQSRWPTATAIDAPLLGGAALFGIGWGMAGYCSGPALASLGAGVAPVVLLVAMMVLGWWLAARLPARNNDAK